MTHLRAMMPSQRKVCEMSMLGICPRPPYKLRHMLHPTNSADATQVTAHPEPKSPLTTGGPPSGASNAALVQDARNTADDVTKPSGFK